MLSTVSVGVLLCVVVYVQGMAQSSEYEYHVGRWSKCSSTCGLGVQTRVVSCVRSADFEIVRTSVCSQKTRQPSARQVCNFDVSCASPPEAYTVYEGQCSKTCGGGVRTASRACRRRNEQGLYERLPLERCANATNNVAPAEPIPCNMDIACPATYHIGQWSSCSTTCGSGYRFRTVRCFQNRGGKNTRVSPAFCREKFGHVSHRRGCFAGVCPDNYQWQATNWTLCSVVCQQTREVKCFSVKDKSHVHPSLCRHSPEPESFRRCVRSGTLVWQASEWNKCSTQLGVCARQRSVSCVDDLSQQEARSCPICLKPHEVEKCAFFECAHENSALQMCIQERGPDGEVTAHPDGKKCAFLQVFKPLLGDLCAIPRIRAQCQCTCLPYSNANEERAEESARNS